MSDIDTNNIRRLDGGLLLIFRELLIHQQASEVADRMGLSQSAISHALKRLRDILGDPLFIRRPHGLEPTRRAMELGPQVEALIALAGDLVSSGQSFDPQKTRRQFTLAAPDFIASIIGASLAATFQRDAPEATFVCRSLIVDDALEAVRRGEVDLAIGHFASIPAELDVRDLFEDQYCVVVRKGHPQINGAITELQYVEIDHVFVGRPAGMHVSENAGARGRALQAYGTIPSPDEVATVAYVSQWETALLIASSTDLIAECPRRLAEQFAEPLGLQVLDAPFGSEMRMVKAVKREGSGGTPQDWLFDQVLAATGSDFQGR